MISDSKIDDKIVDASKRLIKYQERENLDIEIMNEVTNES